MNDSRTRLLHVGGGHTHLEEMRRFYVEKPPGVELTLISALSHHHCSGMVPGYLGGL